MNDSNKSPIFKFLTRKDNLPAVLTIMRYSDEVRATVANQFGHELKRIATMNKPAGLDVKPSWREELLLKPFVQFGLDARVEPFDESLHALRYRIEAGPGYFGVGLKWLRYEKDFRSLCQIEAVRSLQEGLNKRHESDEPDFPAGWWLWWENWGTSTFSDNDPWSWFANREFDEVWYKDKAERFWGLFGETHALVAEANKALKGR